MEKLPPELLTSVCEYVCADHQPSLIAFALTSKQCYAVATKKLFRKIRITLRDAESFNLNVERRLSALEATGCLSYVRHLRIDGPRERPRDGEQHTSDVRSSKVVLRNSAHENQPWEKPDLSRHDPQDPYAEDWTENNPQLFSRTPLFVDTARFQETPLSTLITKLRCLTLVEFACNIQLPSCVLRALETHPNSGIKLHLSNGNNFELDRDSGAVLTSQLLSCVTLPQFKRFESHELPSSIVGTLLASLPSTVNEARIVYGKSGPMRSNEFLKVPASRDGADNEDMGSLRILRFASDHFALNRHHFQTWSRRTRFSMLEMLDVRGTLTNCAMRWMIENTPFVALTDLSISDGLFAEDNDSFLGGFINELGRPFLLSLPPLQGFSMVSVPHPDCLSEILAHHGPSLRRLHFRPTVPKLAMDRSRALNDIEMIRELCPNLQHLTFHIRRTRGDTREVAIYRFLGTLPKLVSLDLTLDASVDPHSPAHNFARLHNAPSNNYATESRVIPHLVQQPYDIKDDQAYWGRTFPKRLNDPFPYREFKNGHIRDAFVNGAVDENLVKSIFRIIASSKGPTSSPLQALKVRVVCRNDLGEFPKVQPVFNEMAQSWIVTPSPRDDRTPPLVAYKLDSPRRSLERVRENPRLDPHVENIFRRIWPELGTGGWTKEWKSFPLDETT